MNRQDLDEELMFWWLLRGRPSTTQTEEAIFTAVQYRDEWFVGITAIIMAHLTRARNQEQNRTRRQQIITMMDATLRASIVHDRVFLLATMVLLKLDVFDVSSVKETRYHRFFSNLRVLHLTQPVHRLNNGTYVAMIRDLWIYSSM
jgi:hypothetical protein